MILAIISHEWSIAFADAVRIVTLAELALVAGLACAVLGIYFLGNIHIAKVDPHRGGALTRYVWTMALSYALLATFGVAEIEGYYGSSLTWRTPIGFVAATFGLYAIINLLTFENNRLDRRDNIVHMEGVPSDVD